MAFLEEDFPMKIQISFGRLIDKYRSFLEGDNATLKARARELIDITTANPKLIEGLTDPSEIAMYKEEIDNLLADLFSDVLQDNEIKIASLPFNEGSIKASRRYDKIIAAAGPDFVPTISDFNEDHTYIMGCSIILNQHYGYKIDFRRPFFYDIPDANGLMRHYRMLYNGDYISIEKGANTKDITDADVAELLDNFDDIDLWKEKFPPRGWTFNGFVIGNLYDATTDVSLSDFKTNLLKHDKGTGDATGTFETIFRAIFNLNDLKIGFSLYNEEEKALEQAPERDVKSFVLNNNTEQSCKTALCQGSYQNIFLDHEYFAVADVAKYLEHSPEEQFYKNLLAQNIGSAIFAPIVHEGKFLALLELASPTKHALNSINANKLLDVMPYLIDSVRSARELIENELELIIQNECTSIHSSVYWKFRLEAKKMMEAQLDGDATVSFKDVVFKEVYPLFGQVDIKGSSQARNTAVQKDLGLQLELAKKVVKAAVKEHQLPIYEELLFRLTSFEDDIANRLKVDSERNILSFFKSEIHPLFEHWSELSATVQQQIATYWEAVDKGMGFIYKFRKEYDESVMLINKGMASVLDKKQVEAQKMYPHFFERFKTDGVEHNMYIGESITREDSFNKIYLYNLRLWQLQVMCEMENKHYSLSRKLAHPLEVASMILVFNASLSVRFRMDEKRFDVDGTYNARYEVVKKRVDKAHIKGTSERVTQAGKITIVYSRKEDEFEYMRYVKFLQSKNYLGNEVEIVELEDLQAVTGLRAIRVNVLYKQKKGNDPKKLYTYEDLMQEING